MGEGGDSKRFERGGAAHLLRGDRGGGRGVELRSSLSEQAEEVGSFDRQFLGAGKGNTAWPMHRWRGGGGGDEEVRRAASERSADLHPIPTTSTSDSIARGADATSPNPHPLSDASLSGTHGQLHTVHRLAWSGEDDIAASGGSLERTLRVPTSRDCGGRFWVPGFECGGRLCVAF